MRRLDKSKRERESERERENERDSEREEDGMAKTRIALKIGRMRKKRKRK